MFTNFILKFFKVFVFETILQCSRCYSLKGMSDTQNDAQIDFDAKRGYFYSKNNSK
jgi:hypothetical protein